MKVKNWEGTEETDGQKGKKHQHLTSERLRIKS